MVMISRKRVDLEKTGARREKKSISITHANIFYFSLGIGVRGREEQMKLQIFKYKCVHENVTSLGMAHSPFLRLHILNNGERQFAYQLCGLEYILTHDNKTRIDKRIN